MIVVFLWLPRKYVRPSYKDEDFSSVPYPQKKLGDEVHEAGLCPSPNVFVIP